MATYKISPNDIFGFTKTDEWPNWIRRFNKFRQPSGLLEKDKLSQDNTSVIMGDKADDIKFFPLDQFP